jgi:hypothetical protein
MNFQPISNLDIMDPDNRRTYISFASRSKESLYDLSKNPNLDDNKFSKPKSLDYDIQDIHEQVEIELNDIAPGNKNLFRADYKRFETQPITESTMEEKKISTDIISASKYLKWNTGTMEEKTSQSYSFLSKNLDNQSTATLKRKLCRVFSLTIILGSWVLGI